MVLTTLVAGDEVEIQDLAEPWVRVLTRRGRWIVRAAGCGRPAPQPVARGPSPPVYPVVAGDGGQLLGKGVIDAWAATISNQNG